MRRATPVFASNGTVLPDVASRIGLISVAAGVEDGDATAADTTAADTTVSRDGARAVPAAEVSDLAEIASRVDARFVLQHVSNADEAARLLRMTQSLSQLHRVLERILTHVALHQQLSDALKHLVAARNTHVSHRVLWPILSQRIDSCGWSIHRLGLVFRRVQLQLSGDVAALREAVAMNQSFVLELERAGVVELLHTRRAVLAAETQVIAAASALLHGPPGARASTAVFNDPHEPDAKHSRLEARENGDRSRIAPGTERTVSVTTTAVTTTAAPASRVLPSLRKSLLPEAASSAAATTSAVRRVDDAIGSVARTGTGDPIASSGGGDIDDDGDDDCPMPDAADVSVYPSRAASASPESSQLSQPRKHMCLS